MSQPKKLHPEPEQRPVRREVRILHQALYRKYRPSTFDDVVGQEHITSVLSWEVANHKVNHAYVFCGSAGTGKTSCAKILAKAVNCENPRQGNPCNCCASCREIDAGTSVEVLEMDAASNTGVDYIREIREEVIFTPTEVGTKVYIIDEVHMLSEGAFNALLKTLEEPPQNVIFVLATTEIQDIPATILSRCQRFDFKRLTSVDITRRLNYIAEQESLSLNPDAAVLIARLAQGGMRDAVSLFELCIDREGNITEENVRASAGIVGRETVIGTVEAIVSGDAGRILCIVAEIFRSSKDMSVFVADLIAFYRDMLVQKILRIERSDAANRDVLDVSEHELNDIRNLSSRFTKEKIVYHIRLLEEAYINMNKNDVKRVFAELTLIRMALGKTDSSYEGLEARIAAAEGKLAAGFSVPSLVFPSGASSEPARTGTERTFRAEENPHGKADAPGFGTIEPIRSTTANKTNKTESPVSNSESHEAERILADWVDIQDDYGKKDPSVAPFLSSSVAYYSDSTRKVTIRLESSFSKIMLDKPNVRRELTVLFGQYGIPVEDLILTVSPPTVKIKDPLTDFDG